MKKVLAFLLTAALLVTAVATTAFAASSPEKPTGIMSSVSATDPQGKPVRIWLETIKPTKEFDAALAELNKTADPKLRIVDYKKLVVEGDVEYPITVTVKVPGVKPGSKGYIIYNGKAIPVTVENDAIVFPMSGVGNLALVFPKDVEIPGGINSPQSGDVVTPIVIAVLVLSLAAAFVAVKKIKVAA